MDVIDNQVSNPNGGFVINQIARQHLMETAKWAKFLSIVGFVFTGLFVIIAFFAGSILSSVANSGGSPMGAIVGAAPGMMVTVIYLLIALLYFFPTLFIYKFAKHVQSALKSDDSHELQIALQNQKSAYKFMGILTIIGLVFYAFMIVIAIVGGGLAMLG